MKSLSFDPPTPRRPVDNPFASHRIERLAYRLPGLSWEDFERRLEASGWRAAIVGPPGSGKTTLLETLARGLGGRCVLTHLPGSCKKPLRHAAAQLPENLTADHIVLLDSAEQFGFIAWRLLLHRVRRAGGLVITVHRPGRLPTALHCRTSPQLLTDLIEELAPLESPRLQPVLGALFDHCNGDIRQCLRALYDAYAGRSQTWPKAGSQ